MSDCQGLGGMVNEKCLLNKYEVSFRDNENVLELDSGDAQHCEYIKCH